MVGVRDGGSAAQIPRQSATASGRFGAGEEILRVKQKKLCDDKSGAGEALR